MLYINTAQEHELTDCALRGNLSVRQKKHIGQFINEPRGRSGDAKPLAEYRFYGLDMMACFCFHSSCTKIAEWSLEKGKRSWKKIVSFI